MASKKRGKKKKNIKNCYKGEETRKEKAL